MASKHASSPRSQVGAKPVSVNAPMSFHRSKVTTVHSEGARGATVSAAHPVVLGPATSRPFGDLASGQLPSAASSTMTEPSPRFFHARRK